MEKKRIGNGCDYNSKGKLIYKRDNGNIIKEREYIIYQKINRKYI